MKRSIFVIISFLLVYSTLFCTGTAVFAEGEADPEALKTVLEEDSFYVQKESTVNWTQ